MVIRKATGSDADDLKTLYFDLPYDNYLLAKVLLLCYGLWLHYQR